MRTEHQIIAVLKSCEAGCTVKDLCREAGLGLQLESKVRQDGRLGYSDIKKMKDLDDQNRRLKQMFADSVLTVGH